MFDIVLLKLCMTKLLANTMMFTRFFVGGTTISTKLCLYLPEGTRRLLSQVSSSITLLSSRPLQDKFIKRCKAISEKVQEEISEVEAEWLTVSDMEKLQFSESLSES